MVMVQDMGYPLMVATTVGLEFQNVCRVLYIIVAIDGLLLGESIATTHPW